MNCKGTDGDLNKSFDSLSLDQKHDFFLESKRQSYTWTHGGLGFLTCEEIFTTQVETFPTYLHVMPRTLPMTTAQLALERYPWQRHSGRFHCFKISFSSRKHRLVDNTCHCFKTNFHCSKLMHFSSFSLLIKFRVFVLFCSTSSNPSVQKRQATSL